MFLQISPYVFALALTSSIPIAIAGIVAQRRNTSGWFFFVLAMLMVSWWTLAYAFELIAISVPLKFFWHKVSYLGALNLPPLWFLFALRHHRPSYRPPAYLCGGLFVLPAIFAILAFSNEFSGWIWSDLRLTFSETGSQLSFSYAPAFWLNAVYAYSLMLVSSLIMGQSALRSPAIFRGQSWLLLGATAIPWVINIAMIAGYSPLPGLDLTPPSFALAGLLIAIALFRYHLLDLMPVAYDLFFACMENEALVVDQHNRLVDANPAARRLLGISEAHIGQPMEKWLNRLADFQCLFQDDEPQTCEISFELNGAQVWRSVQIAPIHYKNHYRSGKLIILNDITQRKIAEEQLKLAHQKALEASQMKTRLLANISHDLRSPLTAILGFTELLRSEVLGAINEQQRNALENIQESANQQLVFINNLIGQAQLETGQIILNLQHFTFQTLIEPILPTVEFMASRKGLDLSFNPSPDLPDLLYGDPYWIRQILLNLVINAIKFTTQGSVNVHLFQDSARQWAIRVSDTGTGIPPDKLNVIFEPFRQLEAGRATPSGSGLGLSIVKQLAEIMKGEIYVESTPGKGSAFTVRLPYEPPITLATMAYQTQVSA